MEVKEKKTLLLKVNPDVYSEFKELCRKEGFSITLSLNQMMKVAIKKQRLW